MDGFRIKPAESYDPNGADGQGRNRLRLEIIQPIDRCALQPRSYAAVWTVQNRPFHLSFAWSDFGYCRAADCANCSVVPTRRNTVGNAAVIREAVDGTVWLLNRADNGWGEFGFPHRSWGELLRRWAVRVGKQRQDSYGVYYEALDIQP